MKKTLILIFITTYCLSQIDAQLWIKNGNDFVGDTSTFHGMTAISVDAQAHTIAISSNSVVIETGTESTFTQVYKRSNGDLTTLGQTIIGDINEDSEVSASSLNEDGTTMILGMRSFDANDNNLSGLIQVYQLQNDQWIEKGQAIGGYGTAASFGTSVDINNDGNTIIAGGEEGVFGGTGGYIQVFDWSDDNWIQRGDSIRKEIPYTEFGSSVNISGDGNIIAVGAQGEFDTLNNIFNAGSITLFNWSSNEWQQMGQKFYGINEMEDLGRAGSFSLSDDGKRLALGNRYHDSQLGKVTVYEWNNGMESWTQLGNILNGEYQQFGDGVNISGDGKTISVTGDYAIQMYRHHTTTDQWKPIGEKITEPLANVGYGFLNDDGNILTAPGTIQIPNFTYLFASLVRFYKFDENATVHTNDLSSDHQISVFPNPTTGEIKIQTIELTFNKFIVSNILGELITIKMADSTSTTLDLSGNQKGIYFITFFDDASLIAHKKIIIH